MTAYDALGRPTSVTAPDQTHATYDYNGLVTTVTDANLDSTTSTKDPWGCTTVITPASEPIVTYTYDELDRLKSALRGGVTTTMNYDNAGRKTSMSDPDMGNWSYGYDALGNLTSQTDARSCTLSLTYDDLNRLSGKSSTGTGCGTQVSTTYGYDSGTNGIGRRTSMTSGTVTNSWSYDARGRAISATVNAGTAYTTQWTYNSADQPVTMTYPGGETVTYGYNSRMLLNSLSGADNYVSGTQYDPAGRVTSRALGNTLTQSFAYYSWNQQGGRLQTIQAGVSNDLDSVQSLEYSYDAVGNVGWIKDWKAGPDANTPQRQAFTYDALNRLTSANVTGGTQGVYGESYTYSQSTGNLASKGGAAYLYNDGAHAHAVTDAGSNHYTYDANGNMTQRVVAGQTYTLGYDAVNRLASVSGPSLAASFVYDGDGGRVRSTINGTTTTFVGNYYQVSGATVTKCYYAGGQRVAMRVGTTAYYLLSDQLGSTSLTTDANGVKAAELRYKACPLRSAPTSLRGCCAREVR